MKLDLNRIEKLKIIKVSPSCIIVENLQGKKGSIFISEVSNSYIVDLQSLYKVNNIVYGYLIKTEGYKRYYSLKIGHTSDSKYVDESGGGNLVLLKYVSSVGDKIKKQD